MGSLVFLPLNNRSCYLLLDELYNIHNHGLSVLYQAVQISLPQSYCNSSISADLRSNISPLYVHRYIFLSEWISSIRQNLFGLIQMSLLCSGELQGFVILFVLSFMCR